MQGKVQPGCANTLAEIRHAGDAIRDEAIAAGETARQAGVFPGHAGTSCSGIT